MALVTIYIHKYYYIRNKIPYYYIGRILASQQELYLKQMNTKARDQVRIKAFIGPMHFSSLGPFGDSRSIVGTTVYSRLSGPMEGKGMHR
jgi:hypothetical protein